MPLHRETADGEISNLKSSMAFYNFACSFVSVWNLVVDIVGGKEVEGVSKHGVEENIWT